MVTVFCGWIRVVKRRGRGSSFVGSTFSRDLIHNERPGSIGYRSGFSKLDNYEHFLVQLLDTSRFDKENVKLKRGKGEP